MSIDKTAFDRSSLRHIDQQLRQLVDETYNLCLYKCTEKSKSGIPSCKQACFKNVIVPYRFHNHAARDEEDNLYRKCLSEKFPNISANDYLECTQRLYTDRIAILSKFMADTAEKVLQQVH